MTTKLGKRDLRIGPVFQIQFMDGGKWKTRQALYHASEALTQLRHLSDKGRMGRIIVDGRVDRTNHREIVEQFSKTLNKDYQKPVES